MLRPYSEQRSQRRGGACTAQEKKHENAIVVAAGHNAGSR